MDFTLSEEQEMLKTMARDFLADKCPKTFVKAMEDAEKGYSPEMWAEMAELGGMGLVFPRIIAISVRRESGTWTIPLFGSIVQKG
jgi:alkylation response protein AidB-like acyl-CoA dehydrogenase